MAKAKTMRDLLREEGSGSPPPSDGALRRFFAEVGAEVERQVKHGATEAASALYTGQAFVLYGRDGEGVQAQQQPATGANTPPPTPQATQEAERDQGMEM